MRSFRDGRTFPQKLHAGQTVANIPEFFLRNPDWHVAYDVDGDLAQATRHKFYDMAAAEKATVVGFQFTFPSIGHEGRQRLPADPARLESADLHSIFEWVERAV